VVASGTLIYLLRHGEVVLAETRRFIGHLDVPLSPTGERQSAAQAGRLASVKLAALYSSDLTRARRTGEIIGAPHGLSPAIVPALREMAMGRWEGLTAAEIQRAEPEKFAEWMANVGKFPFPEGESVPDLEARVWPAFESLAGAHPGEAIAIVAHGGTNRALLCRALGLPPGRLLSMGQDYGALTVLERIDATWRLIHLNERPVL
jgi:alpha-ribazole phosphatase